MEIVCLKSKFLHNLFDQNTYVVKCGDEALLVDAGAEVEDVKQVVESRKVVGILITHIHFDHIWNLKKYIECFDAKVYICKGQEFRFKDSNYNGSVILKRKFCVDIQSFEIEYYKPQMKLGKFAFDVIDTPGHSEDSVCIKLAGTLFVGDLLFYDSVGRTDLTDGNEAKLVESLRKIKGLDYEAVCPGHYQNLTKQRAEEIIDLF